jgi:transcription antitermination protein NusB
VTDPDDPRAEAAADRRDDARRADPADHLPMAFPAHLLPVEADEDSEVVLEEVISAADDGKPLRPRREARETALVLLYEAEARGVDPREVLDAQIVTPLNYTIALLTGISEHLAGTDALITQFARDWRVERMPSIDRCLMRIAVYELGYRSDVPTGVVLAEAVELASRYSTADSSRFVNGILARVAEHLRPSLHKTTENPGSDADLLGSDADLVGKEPGPDPSKDRGIGNHHR